MQFDPETNQPALQLPHVALAVDRNEPPAQEVQLVEVPKQARQFGLQTVQLLPDTK